MLPAVEALLLRFLRFVVEAVVSSSSWLVEICAKAVFLGVGLILGDSEGFSLLLDEDLLDGSSSLEYDEAMDVMLDFLCDLCRYFLDLCDVGGLSCNGLRGREMSKMGLAWPSTAAPKMRLSGNGDRFWLNMSEMSSGLTSDEATEVGAVIEGGPGDCFLTLLSKLFKLKELSMSTFSLSGSEAARLEDAPRLALDA